MDIVSKIPASTLHATSKLSHSFRHSTYPICFQNLVHTTHTAESRHLSPPFHPFAHKPPDQLRRLLRLPLRTSHPQGSVERGHARLRSGQRGQLVLVRTALGRRTATVAGHGRRCRQMMVVVVVVKVVIVQTQLTESMMMMRMLVKVVVIVHGCSSGSQVNGWGYLLGLQLCRVLYNIMLLRWLLLLLQWIRLREKRQRSGLWLELEQIVMMMGMGVVLKLLGNMIALQKRERIQSVGEKELGLLLGLLSLLQRLWRSREGTHRVPVERGILSPERPRRANNHARRVVDYSGSATATCTAGSGTLTIWR